MRSVDPPRDRSVYQTDAACKESADSCQDLAGGRTRTWLSCSAALSALITGHLLLTAAASLVWAEESSGLCREERVQRRANQALVRHLGKACTDKEREARSVRAAEIMEALTQGRGVDLSGVIVTGDLHLENLPTKALDKVLPALGPDDRQAIERLGRQAVRLVSGTFSIRDSEVRGRIMNRTEDATLVIAGPVILSGTRFQETVDLSRAVFLGIVDCSAASFSQESYFVQGRFQQPVLFTQTVFGPHTRFHRSVFAGAANFYHARFNGLAELLEVSFEQGASFSGAQFLSGTGFSGSRFNGIGDFLEAQFQGDVYFLFARFEDEARFRGTAFRAIADFSDAVFAGGQDLGQALFSKPPQLPPSIRGEALVPPAPPTWMAQYGLTIAFLLLSLLLLGVLFKIK